MKSRNSPPTLLFTLFFALACAGTAGLTVWAAETKTPDAKSGRNTKAAKTEGADNAIPADNKRPPLKISVDRKSINRDAPDRVSYAPVVNKEPTKERGMASWYGRKFHGQKTASGEPYDMFAMTAAHKTLPIPSYARVTNVKNGLSVVVRINDRGPFHANRIIDLSYAAAARIGIVKAGSGLVEVERVLPAPGVSDTAAI